MIGETDLCIIHTHAGECISRELAADLDPIDPATLHQYLLPASSSVAFHRHDEDEYRWFVSGEPLVTLWTEAGGPRTYRLQAGDLVACRRGIAHTLYADHPLTYYHFSSIRRPVARDGHLPVTAP